jgi:hypothetical protein
MAGILDHEPFSGNYEVFEVNEFVFSTMGFAEALPHLAEESLIALMHRKVAGIAIKPVVMKTIPEAVARESAKTKVPIFFYEGRYLNHIVTDITNMLCGDEAEWERTSLLDGIFADQADGEWLQKRLAAMKVSQDQATAAFETLVENDLVPPCGCYTEGVCHFRVAR